MEKDPNRFWWLSLLLVALCTVGLWLFQRSVFPATFGGVGMIGVSVLDAVAPTWSVTWYVTGVSGPGGALGSAVKVTMPVA